MLILAFNTICRQSNFKLNVFIYCYDKLHSSQVNYFGIVINKLFTTMILILHSFLYFWRGMELLIYDDSGFITKIGETNFNLKL